MDAMLGHGMERDVGDGPAAAPRTMNFAKTEADEIMVRGPRLHRRARHDLPLPGPDRRLQPEPDREDVSPGVDTKSIELFGPWSEPTDEVTMPADVAPTP